MSTILLCADFVPAVHEGSSEVFPLRSFKLFPACPECGCRWRWLSYRIPWWSQGRIVVPFHYFCAKCGKRSWAGMRDIQILHTGREE